MVSGCANGLLPEVKTDEAVVEAPPSKPKNTPPPAWVLGKGHADYPLHNYVVGIGYSEKSSVSAFQSARSELAKSLKVEIRSKMQDFSTTELTRIESIIETEVDTTLEGVNIQDGWYDSTKGVYYSIAALNRKLAAAGIEERIKSIEASLYQYSHRGEEAESQRDIILALHNYFSGYQHAPSLIPLKSMLRVITQSRGSKEFGSQELEAREFESKIKQITQRLKIATVSGDQQTVKSQKEISEPLKAKVFLQKGNQELPLRNIPVNFLYTKGRGELEQEKVSDSDGLVQTTIYKINSFEETNHTVTVRLDFERFISNFNHNSSENFLLPLKNVRASFNYSIEKTSWESHKSQGWRSGITHLVNQIIENIPPSAQPVIGIVEMKDLRYGKATPFGQILKEDVKSVLAQAEGLTVKETRSLEAEKMTAEEIAKANNLDFYISGSYRMERAGLEVRSNLTETQSGILHSSANITIERQELNPEDLALFDSEADEFKSAQMDKNYQDHLEKLISSKPHNPPFNIEISTIKKDEYNKNEYQIGEEITFSLSAEKDCYLTLLDVSPTGKITVLFPNKYRKDNKIIAGTK